MALMTRCRVALRPAAAASGLPGPAGRLEVTGRSSRSGGELARHQRDALTPGRELVRGQV
jgi:hypothetical protein